ncbi:MAG TPA: SDR family oxidoreductase [Spirochaetes bacterium]|nr:SDR family oxidoreductase [Spirochaetota bacterium]
MFSLDGRVAIVTGAGSKRGIGRATAISFAGQGAKVIICDIDLDGVMDVEGIIKAKGQEALAFKTDVSSAGDIQKVVNETLGKFGKIDILVNNAAINQPVKVIDMSEEDWDRVIAVNLTSAFLFCRAVLPSMIERKYGRIINLSSVAGKTGCISYGGAHYCASKAGILGFSKHLVQEVSPYGITVNSITPGTIATDIRGGLESEEKQMEISARIPCRRFGRTDEVAAAICFLASEEAGYITGEDIDINGGVYMD